MCAYTNDNLNKLFIGSDEVGTGEYFGPIIVVALKFNSIEAKQLLVNEGVKDSKGLTNKEIHRLAEIIKENSTYNAVAFTPNDYWNANDGKFIDEKKIVNLNAVKFKAHITTHNAIEDGTMHVIDKFANESSMMKYANDEGLEFNINEYILEEKAEDSYPEVAAAAILAKAIWYKWMKTFFENEGYEFNVENKFNHSHFHQLLVDGSVKIKDLKSFAKPWKINRDIFK